MNKIVTETATVVSILGTAFAILTAYDYLSAAPVQAEVLPVKMALAMPKPMPAMEYYRDPDKIQLSKRDFACLARNIYYEAGVEGYRGKIAVAQVTWNRVKHGRWGNTVCKVVYAPHQFSWTKQNKESPRGKLWRQSIQAAQDFLAGTRVAGLSKSKFYHATWIDAPKWTAPMEFNTVIGQHVFYTHVR